jgi:ribosomal protein S27AE
VAENAQYTPLELQRIKAEFAGGKMPQCPRCNVAMSRREIGGGSFGLGYARQRDWLICGKCRRSAIFDIQRGTRT